jgi:hypothetical protein
MIGGCMSQTTITEGTKISAIYETVVYPELCTFGIHTGRRPSANYTDLVDIMRTFLQDLETILVPVDGRAITIAEWSSVGFTGWHQMASADDTANSYGSSTELPHQLQAVGSYVNDNELDVAVGRRRNRSYVGPCNSGTIDNSDGRIGDALQEDLETAWGNLQTNLEALGNATSGSAFDGLCVVSEAEEATMDATRVKIGKKYDIHRSRAQKTPEGYSVVIL